MANVRNVLRYMDIMEKRNYNYAALDSTERREIAKIERDVWKVDTEIEAREHREFIKQNYEFLRLYARHELRLDELREKLAADKEMNFDDNTVKLIIQQMRGDQLSDHDKRIAESALEQIQAKGEYGIELQNIKEAQANYRKAQELNLRRQGLFGASSNRNLDVLGAMRTYQSMLENPNSISKDSEEYKNLQNFLAILQPGSKAYTNFMKTAQAEYTSRQKVKAKGDDPITAALRGAASNDPQASLEQNKNKLYTMVARQARLLGHNNIEDDTIREIGDNIAGSPSTYIRDPYEFVLSKDMIQSTREKISTTLEQLKNTGSQSNKSESYLETQDSQKGGRESNLTQSSITGNVILDAANKAYAVEKATKEGQEKKYNTQLESDKLALRYGVHPEIFQSDSDPEINVLLEDNNKDAKRLQELQEENNKSTFTRTPRNVRERHSEIDAIRLRIGQRNEQIDKLRKNKNQEKDKPTTFNFYSENEDTLVAGGEPIASENEDTFVVGGEPIASENEDTLVAGGEPMASENEDTLVAGSLSFFDPIYIQRIPDNYDDTVKGGNPYAAV